MPGAGASSRRIVVENAPSPRFRTLDENAMEPEMPGGQSVGRSGSPRPPCTVAPRQPTVAVPMHPDSDRAKSSIERECFRSLKPDHRELILGCGAALMKLRLVIRSLGVHTAVRLVPGPGQPDLLARVSPRGRHPTPRWRTSWPARSSRGTPIAAGPSTACSLLRYETNYDTRLSRTGLASDHLDRAVARNASLGARSPRHAAGRSDVPDRVDRACGR